MEFASAIVSTSAGLVLVLLSGLLSRLVQLLTVSTPAPLWLCKALMPVNTVIEYVGLGFAGYGFYQACSVLRALA